MALGRHSALALSFSGWKGAEVAPTQGPPTYPFTSMCTEGMLHNAPRKPLPDSPFSLKNPQPVTQQDWDALGGPALNGGRQPGPTRLPQTTGGVTFMRAMSLASEMEEYLS